MRTAIKAWLRAANYVAFCDGEFSLAEKKTIASLVRKWLNEDQVEVEGLVTSEREDFLAHVRSSARDHSCLLARLFPTGIMAGQLPSDDFVAGLIAVKMSDGRIDRREQDAIMDIVALMAPPGVPQFDTLRTMARSLLCELGQDGASA